MVKLSLKSIFFNQLQPFLARLCRFMYSAQSFLQKPTLSGDVETNPGPKPESNQNFSIYYWNLNSITTHRFVKVLLLKANVSIYNFDIIFLSQIYLDSSIVSDGVNLKMLG